MNRDKVFKEVDNHIEIFYYNNKLFIINKAYYNK